MIELYELRQFVTFADTGTLSDTAKILHLSQPALSRNMKKLEDDIGISLFDRKKNKLTLNKNGEYLLLLARDILENADSLILKARNFDRQNHTISLGICAPAPMWTLAPLIANLFPHMSLQTKTEHNDKLFADLDNNVYELIATYQKPMGEQYFFKECGTETLMFSIPKNHKYARRKSLTFSEMNGENMLLMSDIGFWSFVEAKMPDSRFLTQKDRFSFNELIQASSLPSFITNLSEKYRKLSSNRVNIPISDKEATVTYYLVCKTERKKNFKTLFDSL